MFLYIILGCMTMGMCDLLKAEPEIGGHLGFRVRNNPYTHKYIYIQFLGLQRVFRIKSRPEWKPCIRNLPAMWQGATFGLANGRTYLLIAGKKQGPYIYVTEGPSPDGKRMLTMMSYSTSPKEGERIWLAGTIWYNDNLHYISKPDKYYKFLDWTPGSNLYFDLKLLPDERKCDI